MCQRRQFALARRACEARIDAGAREIGRGGEDGETSGGFGAVMGVTLRA